MSESINGETFTTLSDYMNDESKVNRAERKEIEAEVQRIGKQLEQKEKILSQDKPFKN